MGIPTLIKTLTASGSDYLDFVDGTSDVTFDSTYDEYMFVYTDINPETEGVNFTFQVNATDDAGGDYDVSLITSTVFRAFHRENDAAASLDYQTGEDQAQAAGFQILAAGVGADADQSCAGVFHLFSPSSTTYVKHFYSRSHRAFASGSGDGSGDSFFAGYINDTTAIDEIRFKMSADAFDGVIQLFGIA